MVSYGTVLMTVTGSNLWSAVDSQHFSVTNPSWYLPGVLWGVDDTGNLAAFTENAAASISTATSLYTPTITLEVRRSAPTYLHEHRALKGHKYLQVYKYGSGWTNMEDVNVNDWILTDVWNNTYNDFFQLVERKEDAVINATQYMIVWNTGITPAEKRNCFINGILARTIIS